MVSPMTTPQPAAPAAEDTNPRQPVRTRQPEEWMRRTQRFTTDEDKALIKYAREQNLSINDAVRQLVTEGIERDRQSSRR